MNTRATMEVLLEMLFSVVRAVAVSGQWLGKHVLVATQQILNNARVGLQQWKSCVFCVVRTEM
jgi:hypothetical protein